MDVIQKFLNPIVSSVPGIIGALLIFIVALIVANIVKIIIVKGGRKLGIEKYTDKMGLKNEKGSLDFIGNLAFLIVFILFIPGILDKLGMKSVSDPIMNMTATILRYIPNILAAILIIVVGVFLSKLLKSILITLLKRLKVDNIQSKAGIKTANDSITLSEVIANFGYALIIILAIIAALQVLNISSISEPALGILDMIMNVIPLIFVAGFLIFIGAFLSKMAGNFITALLNKTRLDSFVLTYMGKKDGKVIDFSCSKLIGEILRYLIIIIFIVEAFSVIKLDILQQIGSDTLAYLPSLLSSTIIIVVGILFGTWLETTMINKFKISSFLSLVAKYIVFVMAGFMMLNQLRIAKNIVNISFIMISGAIAIAFIISFGLGGGDFAKNTLKKVSDKTRNN